MAKLGEKVPPRLLAEPLVEAVQREMRRRQKTINDLCGHDQALIRSYRRAVHDGRLGLNLADRLCVHMLGTHPSDVFGDDWWHAPDKEKEDQ